MRTFYLVCFSCLHCWMLASLAEAGESKHSCDVVVFPSDHKVKNGERTFVYVQLINEGQKPIGITGGETLSDGVLKPDEYAINVRLYEGGSGNYNLLRGSFNAKSNGDGNRKIILKTDEKIVYKIDLIPFNGEKNAKFCHLSILLEMFDPETKKIEHLEPNLIIMRDRE